LVLWVRGKPSNIMTLGGLALAVGNSVDESTVVMENIHSHLAKNEARLRLEHAKMQIAR